MDSDLTLLTALVEEQFTFLRLAKAKFLTTTTTSWIPAAAAEYEAFLVARAAGKDPSRPLSFHAAWLWHLHLLHPASYASHASLHLDDVVVTPKPWTMVLTSDEEPSLEGSSSIELPAPWDVLHEKQVTFLAKMGTYRLPTRKATRAICRKFLRFLSLLNGSKEFRVPTLEVDYVWHAALHDPGLYDALCDRYAGAFVDHNDLLDDEFLAPKFEATAAAYEARFQDGAYDEAAGCGGACGGDVKPKKAAGCGGACGGDVKPTHCVLVC